MDSKSYLSQLQEADCSERMYPYLLNDEKYIVYCLRRSTQVRNSLRRYIYIWHAMKELEDILDHTRGDTYTHAVKLHNACSAQLKWEREHVPALAPWFDETI